MKLGATLVMLCLVSLSASASRQDDAASLLERVRSAGDNVDTKLFLQLAELGGEASLEALQAATDLVADQQVLYAAYGAFGHYMQDAELKPRVLDFLEQEAFRDKRDEAQRAATWALGSCAPDGHPPLERVLEKHKDATCRKFALMQLYEVLGARGDAKSAKLILETSTWIYDSEYEQAVKALAQCRDDKSRKLMLDKLKHEDSSAEWRSVLVEVLASDSHRNVTRGFAKLVARDDVSADLTARVIDELGKRRAERATKAIKAHLESESEEVRAAALLAVSRIVGPDRVWLKKLRGYASDEDAVLRLAAATALVELRSEDALEQLQGLLADEDVRVRSEALELLAAARDKHSIALFIEQLDAEHGPLRLRIARVLRLLTGEDFGLGAGRWRSWWRTVGAAFVLPSAADALAREFERRKTQAEEGRTQSTFYGLPVLSRNVCFVLDVSGSMATEVKAEPATTTRSDDEPKQLTRLDIAKQELAKVLESLPKDTFANIVFFETDADAWADQLERMDAEKREQASSFVERCKPEGGTDVHAGLALAFADRRIDTLYLLTDGQPSSGKLTEPARLREEVQRWNSVRRVQIHCVSVGRESEFLRDLAAENGGDYRVAD